MTVVEIFILKGACHWNVALIKIKYKCYYLSLSNISEAIHAVQFWTKLHVWNMI